MSATLPRISAIRALLWEDWRRSWVALLCALLWGLGITHTVLAAHAHAGKGMLADASEFVTFLGVFVPLVLYGLVAALTQSSTYSLSPRIPARHYTLPIKPRLMAMVHFGYRLLSLAALAVVLGTFVQFEVRDYIDINVAAMVVAAVALYVVFQALAWTTGNLGGTEFAVALMVVPFLCTVALFRGWFKPPLQFLAEFGIPKEVPIFLALAALAGLAIQGACWGRQRRASILNWDTIRGLPQLFRFNTGGDPVAAQTAYEWRTKGRQVPILTLALVTCYFLMFFLATSTTRDERFIRNLAPSLIGVTIMAAPVAAMLAGILAMMGDYRQSRSGLGLFLFSRALSSSGHARARLGMSVLSTAAGELTCLALMFVGYLILVVMDPEAASHGWYGLWSVPLPTLLMAVIAHAFLVWALFWMGSLAILVWIWAILVAALLQLSGFVDNEAAQTTAFLIGAWVPILVVVGVLVLVFVASLRKKFITRGTLVQCGAALFIAWVCTVRFGPLPSAETGTGATAYAIVVAASLAAVFPILAQPLWVERLRRR